MNTSFDEFDRRDNGNISPTVRVKPNVLPEVQTPPEEMNSKTGVSTLCASMQKEFMPEQTTENRSYWFALRCTYGRVNKAYEYFLKKGIHAFYPTINKIVEKNGEKKLVTESRIPNIFFAHSSYEVLKEYVFDNVHDETKHIRFYYNQHHDGTKEPLIIPDKQIKSLMIICNSDVDDVILEPINVQKFVKGQHVIVKEGPFAGVEGIVARFMGQQRVGISIEGLFTMTTAYIPNAFLEHIEAEYMYYPK